ncbi:MAG: SDR family oxidoreductase [Thiocapsa sp.]|uniref:SDR family NAD(P)-dependent oxidoreductase n=1 Tax=Thiocapsa sp. TaxID=2024551 RepID=UPI001BCBAD79|nr:SDR family NAD(P)-dependent oxidoreductase [Thiocapsa sp.]QVL50111.1 MAG: SDR family oxidoreductase [Thiocapsa sp.]
MITYENSTVLVTGGTRGIGASIASLLSDLGAKVIVTGRHSQQPGNLSSDSYVSVDFSCRSSLSTFLEIVETGPAISLLVNNAGINLINPITEITIADFDEVSEVNYRAPYLIMRAAARNMIKHRIPGRVVNISSIWATVTKTGRSAYCAAKSGVLGMTRAAAIDLASHGILVNAVSPGFVMTDLTIATLGKDGMQAMASQVPVGRLASPDEIARVVAFIGSSQQTYITGQNIIVDGGFTNV